MYIRLNLLEHYLSKTLTQQAAKNLLNNIDWSSGENETVLYMMGFQEDEFEEINRDSNAN
jgi:hypothetical protein